MGYYLTILRSSEGKQLPIELDEARKAASEIGGWCFSESPPTFELVTEQGDATLWYSDGELWAKTPDKWEIDHFVKLAKELGGRVRGDEFETYESSRNTYNHPDDIPLKKIAYDNSAKLLETNMAEQKLIRNFIIGFFVLLGIIGFGVGKWLENL